MTPLGTWRSRLPATIGSWFARDLVRRGLELVESGSVVVRSVEDGRIEATVFDPPGTARAVGIEWGGGTGPLALRPACSDGGSGICAHIVAALEAVRSQTEIAPSENDASLDWLPFPQSGGEPRRARCVWAVVSIADGGALSASLVLDSPRLRGAARDAAVIADMMDATPADDWDETDRDLLRDESVREAFGGRAAGKALARALFRLARHPRLRFDDDPSQGRHPSDLPGFAVDVRGVRLLAVRDGDRFVPALESQDGERFSPRGAAVLDGPPAWLATTRGAYLLDGSFDARRVVAAAAALSHNGKPAELAPRTILRVAPFLPGDERTSLGIVDAREPAAEVALGWTDGALVASLTFVDHATGVRVPYGAYGATAPENGGFVRFTPEMAADLRARMLGAGFVPRGRDGFALHGAERAAHFLRNVLGGWEGVEVRLDPGLAELAGGASRVDVSVSARRSGEAQDWFDLRVDVFVGGEAEPLTQKELHALLSSGARFADVRGRLIDVERLQKRGLLLSDLTERRTGGLAALVALRDELHEGFTSVELPPEVEELRERLRGFSGIERVVPPELHNGALRPYQERGLDFLSYLASFRFGGVLADDMGLGKAQSVDSPVLTPSGWKRMGDVAAGDEVINAQGGVSRVTGVYPQGRREAFEVTFSDGSSTLCCDEHLWAVNTPVRKRRGNPPVVLPLSEIRNRLRDAAGNARYFIPMVEPVRFAQRDVPLDPYLLGLLLVDGGMSQRVPYFTSADEYLVDCLRERLPTGTEAVAADRLSYRLSGRRRGLRGGNTLRTALQTLGLAGTTSSSKFVPEAYKFNSVAARLELLRGLMDTDGTVNPSDNHVEFTSVSQRLAEDVRFLVESLGGTARINVKREPSYSYRGEKRVGKPAYRVSICMPQQWNREKYGPARAIVSVESAGELEMQCIAVDAPDHLYVTDRFIVTHNTVQLISHLVKRKLDEGAAPSLVIAPTSVTHTWENEIRRFAPELKTLRLHSGSERAAKYDDVPGADVVITSYALARIDADLLAKHRFRTLILDEAQNAKNPASQIARVVRGLQAEHRLALTGTPIENSLRDLWAIFAFAEPGLLGTEASFRRRFEVPISDGDETAGAVLRSRLEPFVLRRTKEDVAPELPERVEVELECDLSPLQRRLYRAVAEAARREILPQVDEKGIDGAAIHVLAALTRLRQICAHPGLLFEEYRNEPDASGKFEAFMETVDEVLSGGHRLLVFSAFSSMLRLIRARLDERGLSYGYLDGSTKDRDRNSEVERFMQPDGPPIFLCSLKAGGVGLTLTAADYVILYDPWWNPAVERQAIDRTHRIGQHRNVTAYRLVTRGTVEEKIRALAERKASLSRSVIKADAAVAKSLTREDLEMLFADPDSD